MNRVLCFQRSLRISSVVLAVCLLGTVHAAVVRVAVVGSHDAEPDRDRGVAALAEAVLSTRDGFEVLERQQIDRVLKEQKLSLAGLVDAATVVKAGKLLAVDLFAQIEQSADGKEALACIVFDSHTGVRLCDESLKTGGVEAIADQVAQCVELAEKKRSAGLLTLQTLSLVGVRNADLPRAIDTQCQSLGMLLERELIRSGNVALLERTRLAWLQQEQNLTAAPDARQLLSSILQADLEFSRHEHGVRATLLVTDTAGRQIHKVSSEARQLDATLLGPLIEGVSRGLNVQQVSAASHRPREARRYFREAQLRLSYRDLPGAIQSAEAALLLDPGDPDKTLLLADYLFRYGRAESVTVRRKDLPPGQQEIRYPLAEYERVAAIGGRAVDLFLQDFRQMAPDSPETLHKYRLRTFSTQGSCSDFFQSLPPVESFDDVDHSEWRQVQSELFERGLQIPRERLNVWRDLVRANPGAANGFAIALGMELLHLWKQTWDAEQAAGAAGEFVSGWLDDFDRLPPHMRPQESIRNALGDVTGHIALRPDYARHLTMLLDRLAEHPEPLVQLHGRRGRLFASWSARPARESDMILPFRPIRQDVMRRLSAAGEKSDLPTRFALYEFLYQSLICLSLQDGSAEFVTELREICEPMVSRGELHPQLIEEWARGSRKLDRDAARVGLAIIDSALEVSQSPRYVLLNHAPPQSVRPQLQKTRSDLLAHWPELQAGNTSWRIRTKTLLELAPGRWQSSLLTRPLVRGDTVFAVVLNKDVSRGTPRTLNLKLASVPLAGGPVTFLDAIDIETTAGGSDDLKRVVAAACLHDQRLYVATRAGIVEFHLQTKAARLVPASKSFPTQSAQSIASFDGHLYAGLEGGYLVSFQPDEDSCQILVSSRRKQSHSPLDDREAFDLPNLIPDPERKRLLLHLTTGNVNKGAGEIWEFRSGGSQYRRLLQFTHFPGSVSTIQQGRLIISNGPWFVSLDLATDKPFTASNFPLGPDLNPKRQPLHRTFLADSVYCAGYLWSCPGQSLTGKLAVVSIDAADEQVVLVDLPTLDKDEIYAGWYVAPVDDQRFLWSNHHRLWLVAPEPAQGDSRALGKVNGK